MAEASGAEAEDQTREAQGYNQSIYLMVAMPYLLLGGVGVLIYHKVRQTARAPRPAAGAAASGPGGLGHVFPPLPAEVSGHDAPGGRAGGPG